MAFFRDIKNTRQVRVLRLPVFGAVLQYGFRAFYDFFFLPFFSLIVNSSAVVVLANYSPMPVRGKKIVFMRHPHLVEKKQAEPAPGRALLLEALRRAVFRLTMYTSDVIVVQSEYMRKRLAAEFGPFEQVFVLPNPASSVLQPADAGVARAAGGKKARTVLYVSRFYPHKRHRFLLQLAEAYQEEFRRENVRFVITVSPAEKGARPFLRELQEKGLSGIVCNIGEVSHEALARYYQSARCLFFPSAMETFGNPLIEAMAFGLPLVVPDAGYARAVCGDAGLYFREDDLSDARRKLQSVLTDDFTYGKFSAKSENRFKSFPSVDMWLREVLSLCGLDVDKQTCRESLFAGS
ncbi:MAG: glycosyltransferase [Desulfosalsimonadaceae bacterium]